LEQAGVDAGPEPRPDGPEDRASHAVRCGDEDDEAGEGEERPADRAEGYPGDQRGAGADEQRDEALPAGPALRAQVLPQAPGAAPGCEGHNGTPIGRSLPLIAGGGGDSSPREYAPGRTPRQPA